MRVWASYARLRKCCFFSLVNVLLQAMHLDCLGLSQTVVCPMHTCSNLHAGEHPGPFDHHVKP